MLYLKNQAISSVKWTTLSAGLVSGLQFLQFGVLARLLDPSDFGLLAMVMTIVGFGQLFSDMGISKALIHHQDTSRSQLSSLYWLNIFAGIIVGSLMWIATPLVVFFFQEPRLANPMFWATGMFLITPIGQQFQILLEKDLHFDKLGKIEVIAVCMGTIIAIGTALGGQGIYALIWGQLTNCGVKAGLLARAGWHDWRPHFHFQWQDVRMYVGFGLYQMGERSLTYFGMRLDQLIIGVTLGAQALGYYSFASNLVFMPVYKINPILTRIALPVLAKLQKDRDSLKRCYMTVIRVLAIINYPFLLGLAAAAPVLVLVVFGAEWTPAVILVQLLAIVALLRSTGNPVGVLLLAQGRADIGFKWNAMKMFIQIPGVYLGAYLNGVVGIALALIILGLIYSVFAYVFLIAPTLGPCLRVYLMSVVSALGLAMAIGLSVALVDMGSLVHRGFWLLLTQGGVGLFLFLIAVNVFWRKEIAQLRGSVFRRSVPSQIVSQACFKV